MNEVTFQCRTCGEWHEGFPDLAFGAPLHYAQLDEEERETIVEKSDDLCSIRKEDFFVRAVLRVPVRGSGREFGWGVWVSLSKKNFQRYVELFDAEDVSGEGPYFGWLCNQLPWYEETLHLRIQLHLQPSPQRPLVELEPTDHLLSIHQREGIEPETLQQIIESSLHPVQ